MTIAQLDGYAKYWSKDFGSQVTGDRWLETKKLEPNAIDRSKATGMRRIFVCPQGAERAHSRAM